jgi:hypothetical protein
MLEKKTASFLDSNMFTTHYLVGGLEHVFHILGRIIATDFHIFQRGRSTTNQYRIPSGK